jgi:hypothetical protein
MAKSIDLATDASRQAALLLSYIQAVCAFVAPCPPGASTAIFDRLSHSRALRLARRGSSRDSARGQVCFGFVDHLNCVGVTSVTEQERGAARSALGLLF